MVTLNSDKIQLKYLIGINKCLEGYPTPLDILYDACNESLDDGFYSDAKLENKYNLTPEEIAHVQKELVEKGYIEKKTKNYRIVNTPGS